MVKLTARQCFWLRLTKWNYYYGPWQNHRRVGLMESLWSAPRWWDGDQAADSGWKSCINNCTRWVPWAKDDKGSKWLGKMCFFSLFQCLDLTAGVMFLPVSLMVWPRKHKVTVTLICIWVPGGGHITWSSAPHHTHGHTCVSQVNPCLGQLKQGRSLIEISA